MNNFTIRKLERKDIPDCYNIYCENIVEYDIYLELKVLPKNFPSLEEFTEFFKEKKEDTEKMGLCADISVPLRKNPKIQQSSLVGFALAEVNNSNLEVTIEQFYMLPKDQEVKNEISHMLLSRFIDAAKKAKKVFKIIFHISEKETNLCKIAFQLGFTKERMLFAKNVWEHDTVVMQYKEKR